MTLDDVKQQGHQFMTDLGDSSYSAFDALFGGQKREQRAYNESIAARELEFANTAHQREVADLKAAGLNPWLSAQGQGAGSPTITSTTSSAADAAKDTAGLMKVLAMAAAALIMAM